MDSLSLKKELMRVRASFLMSSMRIENYELSWGVNLPGWEFIRFTKVVVRLV